MSGIEGSYTTAFKLEVCERIEASGNLAALGRELGVRRATLFKWRTIYRAKGAAGFGARGRLPTAPPAAAGAAPARPAEVIDVDPAPRIAELERKIGQQALELDFFRAALRHVGATRR